VPNEHLGIQVRKMSMSTTQKKNLALLRATHTLMSHDWDELLETLTTVATKSMAQLPRVDLTQRKARPTRPSLPCQTEETEVL
jgi:hypothetical protein